MHAGIHGSKDIILRFLGAGTLRSQLHCFAERTLILISEKGFAMSTKTLHDIARKLQKIDFCMMSTHGEQGAISNRPMSSNGDVEYDGDSWFFSYDDTAKIADIGRNPQVSLSFSEPPSLLGKPGIFISIEGQARVIRDKAAFEEHWLADLERWFPQGTDTPGLVLIEIRGTRVQYWDGEENGTFRL